VEETLGRRDRDLHRALEPRLYGPKLAGAGARPLPDPAWIHTELRRAGVTLELLHLEYLQAHPDGYRYSAFCRHYRDWLGRQRLSMRQVHKAGDKLFVDYSGKKPEIVDSLTGVVRPVELFVAVLGASNYTYAEATETQRSADFSQSHGRTLEYRKSSPCPVTAWAAEAERRMDYVVMAGGSVTVPGTASAASVAVSRYVWGSTPTSFADSHRV
jgi:transposase